MLPLSLFRTRAFSTAAFAGLLVNLVFFGLIFALSLFLQRQQGLSPLATGLAFLPVTVLIVVSNLVAGRILPARGTRAVAWARGAAHGSRLPGHARPASRPCRPAGPGADRGPVTDRVRHRPGRHRHHLRPARQRGPGPVRDRVRHLHRLPADRQRPGRRPVRHPVGRPSTRPPAWKSPSRSAPGSLPSSPRSDTPPPDPPARPASRRERKRRHMAKCHCPYDNAPVTPARQPFGIAIIGGPTAVIDIARTRLVTALGLDPPGGYRFIRETDRARRPSLRAREHRHHPAQPRPSPKFHGTRDFLRRAWQIGCSRNSPDRK